MDVIAVTATPPLTSDALLSLANFQSAVEGMPAFMASLGDGGDGGSDKAVSAALRIHLPHAATRSAPNTKLPQSPGNVPEREQRAPPQVLILA
jgi:hypothetical protein